MKKRMILIDGTNVMYRAYYGTAYSGNLMKNSKGQYTNAVYGFVSMINKILEEDFTHILVAFDKSSQTFRHEEFPNYKAGRKPMPEEFKSQISLIKKSLDVLGVKQREIQNIEADDIIGTYATKYYDKFDDIVIISNDKDLLQLVNDKVHLRASKKGITDFIDYNVEYMKQNLGISSNQITDLKGLMGDPSDNLPGIPGVGEKTAVKLLKEYGSLEEVVKNKDNIKGKLGERIRKYYQDAILCKKIATIKTDVPFHFTIDEIKYEGVNETQMLAFFKELELHSLIKRFNKKNKQSETIIEYETVTDLAKIRAILINNSYIVLEAYGTNYHYAKPLGFGIVNEKGKYFIPYELIHISIDLQVYLFDKSQKKYVFDAKQISYVLQKDGFIIDGVVFDLLLASYLLKSSNTKEDFRVIVSNFDYDDVPYLEEVYGKGKKQKIPAKSIYETYAIKKAYALSILTDVLTKRLKENNQWDLFVNVELPLAFVLADMEKRGVKVDIDLLNNMDISLKERIDELTKEIHQLSGETFNIQSPSQLGVILFDKLKLPNGKKTKTGYSTSASVLESLIDKHPIINKVLEYRRLTKLHGTYIIGLRDSIYDDKKVHTIYKQAFTSTGRLSSIEPNLQNIPIKTKEGREIRALFIPENDYFLSCDYSQIELRVLAHMAKEETLIEAFKNGEDIHTKTAQLLFGKKDITPIERRKAKAVNFGILYGQSVWGLSEGVNISPKEAKEFIELYYQRFPGIKKFMDNLLSFAKEKGYVETLFNRRRYIPELNSSVYMQKEAGKRNAMNAPIQGTAADIIKIAMVKINKKLNDNYFQSKMILQIHDELVFDVKKEEKEDVLKMVKTEMENAVKLLVPLTVEAHFGRNLKEGK